MSLEEYRPSFEAIGGLCEERRAVVSYVVTEPPPVVRPIDDKYKELCAINMAIAGHEANKARKAAEYVTVSAELRAAREAAWNCPAAEWDDD